MQRTFARWPWRQVPSSSVPVSSLAKSLQLPACRLPASFPACTCACEPAAELSGSRPVGERRSTFTSSDRYLAQALAGTLARAGGRGTGHTTMRAQRKQYPSDRTCATDPEHGTRAYALRCTASRNARVPCGCGSAAIEDLKKITWQGVGILVVVVVRVVESVARRQNDHFVHDDFRAEDGLPCLWLYGVHTDDRDTFLVMRRTVHLTTTRVLDSHLLFSANAASSRGGSGIASATQPHRGCPGLNNAHLRHRPLPSQLGSCSSAAARFRLPRKTPAEVQVGPSQVNVS